MDLTELDLKYKPSAWNPQSSAEEVIARYLAIGAQCLEENQRRFLQEKDVRFGASPRMALDVYGTPALSAEAPLFVFVHGGFWQEGSKEGNTFCVEPLVRAGYRVLLLGYDLCPTVRLRDLRAQVHAGLQQVLRMARERWSSARVVLCGHSAGAWLAMAALTEPHWQTLPHVHLLRTVVLLGGVYDVAELRHTQAVNRDNLLGLTDADVEELSLLGQSYAHLEAATVRVWLVSAEWEAPGLKQQAEEVLGKWAREGVHHLQMPAMDHFDLVTELRREQSPLTQRLLQELRCC